MINPQYYKNVISNDMSSNNNNNNNNNTNNTNNLFLGCTPITSNGLYSILSILYNNLAIIANEIENMSFAYSQGNFQYLFTTLTTEKYFSIIQQLYQTNPDVVFANTQNFEIITETINSNSVSNGSYTNTNLSPNNLPLSINPVINNKSVVYNHCLLTQILNSIDNNPDIQSYISIRNNILLSFEGLMLTSIQYFNYNNLQTQYAKAEEATYILHDMNLLKNYLNSLKKNNMIFDDVNINIQSVNINQYYVKYIEKYGIPVSLNFNTDLLGQIIAET